MMRSYPRYWNEKMETMSPEEMRHVQEKKLLDQVAYCYEKSQFYREKFDSAGLKPKDIKKIEDLEKLPFTEKEELRISIDQAPPLGKHRAASMEEIIRIHGSSGTTGRPSFIGLTRHDADVWNETCARCVWTLGYRPNYIVIHAWNYSIFVGGVSDHIGTEMIGATVIPMGVGNSARLVHLADHFKVDAINATASYFSILAPIVRQELGKEPAELGIKKLACGAEPGAGIPSIRKLLQETWNADAYNVTGLSDVFGWHGAECEYKKGMHYAGSDFCLFELIDVNTQKVLELADGVEGEIVYTMIDRQASPLLRFRSHDYAVVWTSKCDCGRTTLRFEIKGRNDDMLIVKGVNVFPTAIEDVLKRFVPEITGEFQILLDHPSPLTKIKMRVEYGHGFDVARLAELKKRIEDRMREMLLFKAEVDLVPPLTMPRVEYKPKRLYKLYEGEKP